MCLFIPARKGSSFKIFRVSFIKNIPSFLYNLLYISLANLISGSSSTVQVELIDQYGGNFSASIDGGMSQNHTLKVNSEIKVGGNTVHVVASGDEGKEIVVAGP